MIYRLVDDCQIRGLSEIYEGVFGPGYIGTFVEVGAHDGHQHSNTFFLAEDGWMGLYIEPMQELYNRCIGWHKSHPNIYVHKAACGFGETVSFHCKGNVSNYATGSLEQGAILGATKFVEDIRTVTLDSVLAQFNIRPGFDLLVVDVEGMELSVLNGFNIRLYIPKLCIIETHKYNENLELAKNAQDIYSYMIIAGYQEIYADTINSIFVRR